MAEVGAGDEPVEVLADEDRLGCLDAELRGGGAVDARIGLVESGVVIGDDVRGRNEVAHRAQRTRLRVLRENSVGDHLAALSGGDVIGKIGDDSDLQTDGLHRFEKAFGSGAERHEMAGAIDFTEGVASIEENRFQR